MSESKEAKEATISKQIFDDLNKKVSELETSLASEQAEHLTTKQLNASLQQTIEEMELEGTKAKPAVSAKVIDKSFKVDKIDYVLTVPAFQYKGQRVTAEQLLNSKEMQKELVEAGAGIIKRKGAK